MPQNYFLQAFLPDVQTNRIYFEFRLIFNSKEALFSDEEIVDKSIKLKKIDVQSKDDSECDALCHFEANHKVIGRLKLSINVDQSKISILNVRLGDFDHSEELCDNYEFDFDADKQFEFCFAKKSLQETFPTVQIEPHSISVYFYFSLTASIENYPEPSQRDLSLCAIFDRPSADLLNDWVFCGHNHSSGESSSAHHSHAEVPESITIPEELYKPVVLDKIEQIIYLLTDASPLVLLESADQKDNSIYLELIKSDEIYCLDCCCSSSSSSSSVDCRSNGDNNNGNDVNEEETEKCVTLCARSEGGPRSVSFLAQCLVQHQIFAQQCNEQEAVAEEGDDKPSIIDDDDKRKKAALQLKKYRLSFEVDWFRIEAKLYSHLVHLLTDSSRYLRRLADNIVNFEHHSTTTASLCSLEAKPMAVLSNYRFVKEATAVTTADS